MINNTIHFLSKYSFYKIFCFSFGKVQIPFHPDPLFRAILTPIPVILTPIEH